MNAGVSGHLTFQHGGDKGIIAKPGGSGNVTPTLASSSKVCITWKCILCVIMVLIVILVPVDH